MAAATRTFILQLLWFLVGLTVMSLGLAMVIRPGLGAAPWDIFHLGIARQLSCSFGLVVQGVGLAIILMNIPLGERPSIGTVLNMLIVGPETELFLNALPDPSGTAARWAMLGVGLGLAGLGTAWYISAGLGAGPRDGLMVGLTRKLRLPVAVVKNGLDITVALAGWQMGGPLGVGTVVVALGMGPAVQAGMAVMVRVARLPAMRGFVRRPSPDRPHRPSNSDSVIS
ncbi:MAG TPA: hypothetical protein VIL07_04415 [Symbiobacteriaceae bacterium]